MDLFTHIGENRDEIIAIPFYGWVRNPVETMIRLLMHTGKFSIWCNKYQILRIMPTNDPERLFTLTMQYTINSFYETLLECGKLQGLEKNDVEKDFNEMIMRADPKLSCKTVMDIMLSRLITEDFVKQLHIYVPAMTKNVKDAILDIFTIGTDSIFLAEADLRKIIECQNPKFTTIFVEDTDMFMDIIQSYSPEDKKKYMSNTYYILPAKSSLTERAKRMSQDIGMLADSTPFKYQEFIKASLGEVGSYADFLQLKMLTINTQKDEVT